MIANYILAVKDNQAALLESIQDEFLFSKQITKDVSVDGDHGRIETRTCSVIINFQHVVKDGNWKNLNAVVKIESKREFKNSDKPTENAVRHYISSCDLKPKGFQKAIRSHWAIENKLH